MKFLTFLVGVWYLFFYLRVSVFFGRKKWRTRWIPQLQFWRTISGAQIQNQVLPKSLQRTLSLKTFQNLVLGGTHFFSCLGMGRRNRWTRCTLSVPSSSPKEWALAWGRPLSQVVSWMQMHPLAGHRGRSSLIMRFRLQPIHLAKVLQNYNSHLGTPIFGFLCLV